MLQNVNFMNFQFYIKDCIFCYELSFKDFSYSKIFRLAFDLSSALNYAHSVDITLGGDFNLSDIYFEVCGFFFC